MFSRAARDINSQPSLTVSWYVLSMVQTRRDNISSPLNKHL